MPSSIGVVTDPLLAPREDEAGSSRLRHVDEAGFGSSDLTATMICSATLARTDEKKGDKAAKQAEPAKEPAASKRWPGWTAIVGKSKVAI